MERDNERIECVVDALRAARLDALICSLPANVLLLSGYWPVIGTSLVIFNAEGGIILLVPSDEDELAKDGWADEVLTFESGSLNRLSGTLSAVQGTLSKLLRGQMKTGSRIGFECGPRIVPAPYAAVNSWMGSLAELLKTEIDAATLVPADEELARLRSTLTNGEICRVKIPCSLAAEAFRFGRQQLTAGITETAAANTYRTRLSDPLETPAGVKRIDGFTYCMSGPNSFEASAAFQRSRSRCIKDGDLVLMHCNSYADGFWTDITRTYLLGEPTEEIHQMFETVFEAREAAIREIGPGVPAKRVDAAARDTLSHRGYGREFVHGLGHGVGFAAIDHNALPRLHPASIDILEAGMVFNVEPAIYIKNTGGIRHCDMVVVTENGSDLLTPFQSSAGEMMISRP